MDEFGGSVCLVVDVVVLIDGVYVVSQAVVVVGADAVCFINAEGFESTVIFGHNIKKHFGTI